MMNTMQRATMSKRQGNPSPPTRFTFYRLWSPFWVPTMGLILCILPILPSNLSLLIFLVLLEVSLIYSVSAKFRNLDIKLAIEMLVFLTLYSFSFIRLLDILEFKWIIELALTNPHHRRVFLPTASPFSIALGAATGYGLILLFFTYIKLLIIAKYFRVSRIANTIPRHLELILFLTSGYLLGTSYSKEPFSPEICPTTTAVIMLILGIFIAIKIHTTAETPKRNSP